MSQKNSKDKKEFLSKEYFQKILENDLSTKNIQIENIEISSGSSVGENYTSFIYRAEIKYRLLDNNNLQYNSFIIKHMHITEELEQFDAFTRESKMYTLIMPKIEKLYENIEKIAPKCFYLENRPGHQNLILQDMKPFGYMVADRLKRLDESHCKLVLQKVGRYHAGTIILSKMEPEIFKYFDNGAFQPDKFTSFKSFENIFVNGLDHLMEFVSKWDGYENITEKLVNLRNNFQEASNRQLKTQPDDIRVLNHSDLWTNNMLFKYENGKVIDVRLIDLQLSSNDSLGMDINYFLHTSVSYDLLKTKREELIRIYYESFRASLEELQYPDIPNWESVRNEVRKREFFGFLTAYGICPILLLDRETCKDTSYEMFLDDDIFRKKRTTVFSNPDYMEFMKYSLKRFDELGIFD